MGLPCLDLTEDVGNDIKSLVAVAVAVADTVVDTDITSGRKLLLLASKNSSLC
jgi:hypothetical protein